MHADSTPPRQGLSPLLALVTLIVVGVSIALTCSGILMSGSQIRMAEEHVLVVGGELAAAVDQQAKIIGELSSRGANKQQLQELYNAIEPADGLLRGRRARAYAAAVNNQVINIGDIRGTALQERHAKLAGPVRTYDEAMAHWSSSSSGPIGWIAVTIGIANRPQEYNGQ